MFTPPIGAVGEALEDFPVVREKVELLPAGLEVTHHNQSLRGEEHVFHPIGPGAVLLAVDGGKRAVGCADCQQFELLLHSRGRCLEERS